MGREAGMSGRLDQTLEFLQEKEPVRVCVMCKKPWGNARGVCSCGSHDFQTEWVPKGSMLIVDERPRSERGG